MVNVVQMDTGRISCIAHLDIYLHFVSMTDGLNCDSQPLKQPQATAKPLGCNCC